VDSGIEVHSQYIKTLTTTTCFGLKRPSPDCEVRYPSPPVTYLKQNNLFVLDGTFRIIVNVSTLKIEAICSSETAVDTQRTTRRYILEDGTLHKHRCENLKSYMQSDVFHFTLGHSKQMPGQQGLR
jgi:hypothetical protein